MAGAWLAIRRARNDPLPKPAQEQGLGGEYTGQAVKVLLSPLFSDLMSGVVSGRPYMGMWGTGERSG